MLALALIQQADVPVAAPSANASTKPSPTTAAHVLNDLSGRIDLILDGGPCDFGVESTVVDGLSKPPVVLRPGGISIEMLKRCPGWENVAVGYKDGAEKGVPRAPGMKYKHYSPNAKVILVDGSLDASLMETYGEGGSIGILATKSWDDPRLKSNGVANDERLSKKSDEYNTWHSGLLAQNEFQDDHSSLAVDPLPSATQYSTLSAKLSQIRFGIPPQAQWSEVWTVTLGRDMDNVARGLFAALRELDQKGVGVIFVESVNDKEGDSSAAVMNRLRKAAQMQISGR